MKPTIWYRSISRYARSGLISRLGAWALRKSSGTSANQIAHTTARASSSSRPLPQPPSIEPPLTSPRSSALADNNLSVSTSERIVMASLSATAMVVRPGLARGKTSAPKVQAQKSCAMSGLTGSAPAFMGKPSALSAGIVTAGGARGAGSRSVATMGLFGLGLPELVVIGGVAAVLFGPSKLPELGKSLGKTVKSFQAAANVRTRPHPRAAEDPRSSSHSATRVLELLPLS